jgi:hypothetical protein
LEASLSPILVRPVREQLEHDRIIRLLQAKFKRKFEVGINPGAEQNVPIGSSSSVIFPDLVLQSPDRGRKMQAVIEVETGESVNHLEALAEWGPFAQARAPFHLYVPAGMVDVARRLCDDNHVYVSEIWSYHTVGDQVRFTMVFRNKEAPPRPVAPRPPVPRPVTPRPVTPRPVTPRAVAPRPVARPAASRPAAARTTAAPLRRKPAARAAKAKRAKAVKPHKRR